MDFNTLTKDGRFCDNCFLRYFSESAEPIPGRTEGFDRGVSRGVGACCAFCGHPRGKTRPLSKASVRRYAERLSQSLEEESVAHDSDLLVNTAIEQWDKHNGYTQPYPGDERIFGVAVKRSKD